MTSTTPYRPSPADQARLDRIRAEHRQEIAAEATRVPPPGPCPSWCELPAGHSWTESDGGLLVTGGTVPIVLRCFHMAARGSWQIHQADETSAAGGVTPNEPPYAWGPDNEDGPQSLAQLRQHHNGLDDAIALLDRATAEHGQP